MKHFSLLLTQTLGLLLQVIYDAIMILFNDYLARTSFAFKQRLIDIQCVTFSHIIILSMDPFKHHLLPYSELPFISADELQRLKKQKRLVLFKNLVLDITDFKHPGYDNTLVPFQNQDIYQAYTGKLHSFNADLIVCYKTIGKLEKSIHQIDGQAFYQSLYNHDKVKRHQQILKTFSRDQPLNEWTATLTPEEWQLVSEIPKIVPSNVQITFQRGSLRNFLIGEQKFWVSFTVFVINFFLIAGWVFRNYSFIEIISSIHMSVMGVFLWTFLEYYTHRFKLHEGNQMNSHLKHHAFPSLKRKVALSWSIITVQLFLMILVSRFLFSEFVTGMFFMGFSLMIILYDCMHYYCHFGPQLEIKWLKTLRINHLKHHYRDQHTNFGVTTNFWDKVFGTYDSKSKDQ